MRRVRLARWAVLVAWLGMVLAAHAQLATSGHADGMRADEHAWAITPSTTSNHWGLWHIPPRFGRGGADDGEVRIVNSLERQPAAIAASSGRVWMGFAGTGNRAGYGVLTAAVRRGAIEGTWYTGSGGRLASGAFLPTKGRLIAMGAGQRGPVALVEIAGEPVRIAWLERGTWHWAIGPAPNEQARPTAVGVLADGTVALVGVGGGAIHLWRASLPETEQVSGGYALVNPDTLIEINPAPSASDEPLAELDWSLQSTPAPDVGGEARVVGGPVGIGDRVVLALASDASAHVVEVDGDEVREVYAAPVGGVALLPVSRRGIIVRLADGAQSAKGRAATRLVLEEFSLDTGRVLYRGPAVFDGPVSPSDIRLLLVLMLLVSATLLLFVVRSSNESRPFVLPRGCVLAPPMPRLIASVADGLLALVLGGELAALLPEGWLAIRIGADVLDFAPLLMALALGFVACSALEAAFGRTPGKFIFGLFVTQSGTEGVPPGPARRPGIGASLARNAVKWLLPLVALAGVMSPTQRHRGDTMTGLGVVGELDGAQTDQDREPDDR